MRTSPSTLSVTLLRGVTSVIHSGKHQQIQNEQRTAYGDGETQCGGVWELAEVLLLMWEHLAPRHVLQQASDVTCVGIDEQSGCLPLVCLGRGDEASGCRSGWWRQEVAGQIAGSRRTGVRVSLVVVRQLMER